MGQKQAKEGSMAEEEIRLIRQRIRSPRSAAIAGIIYSILMIIGMALTRNIFSSVPAVIDRRWLLERSDAAHLVVTIVPFAGLAFLWFTGVIRDRLGASEDRFFSTIFLGSGIISVMLLFVWGGTAGALFGTLLVNSEQVVDNDIYIFGFALMNEIIGNYALRMGGAYMLSIGTIWTRTGRMPRWMSIVTFILAMGFLLFANRVREARFLFPGWVLVVSVYILILNYRRTHDEAEDDG
jgi:hypothetical protein